MTSSPPDYHEFFEDALVLRNEILATSTSQLIEHRDIITGLLADMKDTGADTSWLERYVGEAVEEIERRRDRYKRRKGDTYPPTWPSITDFERWRAEADAVKDQVSVDRYLSEQAPWIEFRQQGDRLLARCPFPDHDDQTPSFVIFEDGGAWCFGCNRGGDLFRIIGLMEGHERFRDQLARALEFVPRPIANVPQNRSFPSNSPKGPGRKEQSGGAFQPIKIGANGRVVS